MNGSSGVGRDIGGVGDVDPHMHVRRAAEVPDEGRPLEPPIVPHAIVADVVGYEGPVEWDASKPDGTPRKLLDSSRIASMGWQPKTDLREGIRRTYEWFLQNRA